MRIWSIYLNKFNPIQNGVYILLEISFWIDNENEQNMSLLVDQRVSDGTCSQVLRLTSIDS